MVCRLMCPVFPELVYTIRGGLPTYPEVLRAISIPELIRFEQAAFDGVSTVFGGFWGLR